jgi:hypothetical protein
MAMRCPMDWEIYRRAHPAAPNCFGDRHNGALVIPARRMAVIFSAGEGWEHVSVSLHDRCPTWEEMAEVKRRFWEPADVVMQLHVAESQHLNCHPYCLHLWRPLHDKIPLPPPILVAPPVPK